MSRRTRDGTAKPVSRDQILRRERGHGKYHIPCSADHVQDWHSCRLMFSSLLNVMAIHKTFFFKHTYINTVSQYTYCILEKNQETPVLMMSHRTVLLFFCNGVRRRNPDKRQTRFRFCGNSCLISVPWWVVRLL